MQSRGTGLLQQQSSAPPAASLVADYPRQAASAACANALRTAKNAGDWPMNSPSAVKALTVATAAPAPADVVGRMIETAGNLRLRQAVGSGRIRVGWKFVGSN